MSPEKLYGLKPESCMSPEILKSVCNISLCLSDNETKQADNCEIESRSLSNDAMVRRNKRDECVLITYSLCDEETKQAR